MTDYPSPSGRPGEPGVNGEPGQVAAHRALTELRCGRAVVVRRDAQDPGLLVAALETAESALLARLQGPDGTGLDLALTAERAQALGHPVAPGTALLLSAPQSDALRWLDTLAQNWRITSWVPLVAQAQARPADDPRVLAALQLIKHAQLLPAVVCCTHDGRSDAIDVLRVDLPALQHLQHGQDQDIQRISEARVPLRDCEDSRLVLFRDRRDGTEHVAIQVGQPDLLQPVPLRLHSSCMTGDLLGSLRCDCGEQLATAVERLAAADGGLLLYLAQEGRGIGLANKLRAYQLQDDGLDTIDADLQLGFSSDERRYEVAAAMLRHLQVPTVRLLTNSPHKVRALRAAGIDVAQIGTLPGTPNPHNARYIRTKQQRAGHFHAPVDDEQD